MSQKKYHVDLTSEERSILTRLIQNRKSTSSLVKRAYILLAADRQGSKVWKDQQISEAYGVRRKTVENIRLLLQPFTTPVAKHVQSNTLFNTISFMIHRMLIITRYNRIHLLLFCHIFWTQS